MPSLTDAPAPREESRGSQLPVMLPRGVTPNKPFRPLDADDKALLVTLSVRSGFVSPVGWGAVALVSAAMAVGIYSEFYNGDDATDDILRMVVWLTMGSLIATATCGATWIKRMIERRQKIAAAGLEKKSTLRLLRMLSLHAVVQMPRAFLGRITFRKNRVPLNEVVERKLQKRLHQ